MIVRTEHTPKRRTWARWCGRCRRIYGRFESLVEVQSASPLCDGCSREVDKLKRKKGAENELAYY